MNDDIHPAVQLLVERAKSHPEEFENSTAGRWGWEVKTILESGSEADKAALITALRPIRMGEVHKRLMRQLLTGSQAMENLLREWVNETE